MEYDIEDQPPPYTYRQNFFDISLFIEIYTLIVLTISILLALTDINKLLCLYIYALLHLSFFIIFKFFDLKKSI